MLAHTRLPAQGPPMTGHMTAHFSCDSDYRIVSADAMLAQLVGIPASELAGLRAIELIAPPSRPAMMEAAARLRRGVEGVVTASCALDRYDAAPVPVTIVIAPLGVRGVNGISCVVVPAASEFLAEPEPSAEPEPPSASVPPASPPPPTAGPATGFGAAALLGRREEITAQREALTAQREALLAEREAFVAEREHRLAREEVAVVTRDAAARAAREEVVAEVAALAADRSAEEPRPATRRRGQAYENPLDALTGLATRTVLRQELDRVVASQTDYAVLLVDLDEFKAINDTHGHDVGDEVLTHVAARLRASVRPDDLVVRFGGDEFVVLCRNRAAALTVAERIVAQLASPATTSAGPVTITASVGISDSTISVAAAADLLTRADAAMYWAKRLGKNRYFVYDSNLHAQVARDRQTEALLRAAIGEQRMLLHFQPIVDVGGAGVVAVEAVTRLVDDEGRVRLPREFLSVAERSGLICAMDSWVLAESCRRIATIRRSVGRPLCVSVNVSGSLFARPDFAEVVRAALADAAVPASALMLELTESVLLQADPQAIERLAGLRAQGVAIAVDDFGAGFSPLAFLRRLPLSHVKVSRPWITSMVDDDRDSAMMEALTWLVDQLGLEWVAEGVETDAQWQAIRQFGPGCAQGFLFARPLAEEDLIRTIRSNRIGTVVVDGGSLQPA